MPSCYRFLKEALNAIHLGQPFRDYLDQDEKPLERLEAISSINLFVGANNSGKSRFMRLLATTEPRFGIKDIPLDQINSRFTAAFSAFARRMNELHILILSNFNSDRITSFRLPEPSFHFGQYPFTDIENLLQALLDINTYDYIQLKNGSRSGDKQRAFNELTPHLEPAKEALELVTCLKDAQPRQNVYIPILRGLRPLDDDTTLVNLLQSTKDYYTNRTTTDYFRDVPKERRLSVFTGLTLYMSLVSHLLGDQEKRKRIREFEGFLTDTLFGGDNVTLTPHAEQGVVYIQIGSERERAIYNLGDGLQSIIILTYMPWIIEEPAFFFIEEPELHLHPGMQRRLLETYSHLAQTRGHTFFVTTHSNHLLDLTADISEMAVFTMRKQLKGQPEMSEPGIQPKFIVEQVDSGDDSSLDLLGVRNSSVFLVNATIWVEGITDRLYLRKFLDLYRENHKGDALPLPRLAEDLHYSFVEYGGSNIAHWSFIAQEDTSKPARMAANRLCAKAMVIIDQDGEAKMERKQELQDILDDRLIILPCREVENLLPCKVIAGVIAHYEKRNEDTEETKKEVKAEDYMPESYESYQHEYLGQYIEETIFKNRARKREASYKEKSGTLNDKVGFCRNALPLLKSWDDLPPTTQTVIERIYRFIRNRNT